MNVAELIAELQKYDPGLQVSVTGYHGLTDQFTLTVESVTVDHYNDKSTASIPEHLPIEPFDFEIDNGWDQEELENAGIRLAIVRLPF